MNREILNIVNKVLSEEITGKVKNLKNKIFENKDMKKQMCSECGGKMHEGECMECGNMYESDNHPRFGKKSFSKKRFRDDFNNEDDSEEIELNDYLNENIFKKLIDRLKGNHSKKIEKNEYDELTDEQAKRLYDNANKILNDELNTSSDQDPTSAFYRLKMAKDTIRELKKHFPHIINNDSEEIELDEKLYGKQYRIDKNKNGIVDREDLRMTRSKKTETKENEMYELHLDESTGEKFIFSESDMVDIIENIVLEEKSKKPKKGKNSDLPKSVTKDSQSKSKSENDKYIASVVKKMSTYLKDGSKGKYEMNPKHFPKGNGELEKMDKMAFEMSPDNEDFNYEIGGLNNPVSDGVQFDDDLMTKHYEGSSETGNAPGGNALKSDANTRFNEFRKKNTLHKLKNQSYKRVPTPVFNEKSGQGKGEGPKIKLESVNDTKVENKPTENKHIITEVEKIKNLMGYNQKTQ